MLNSPVQWILSLSYWSHFWGPLQAVVEYLCALYFLWKDPDEQIDRLDEAKHWLERLAELDPRNNYANFYCGMILTTKA
jgi:hypothetical protein